MLKSLIILRLLLATVLGILLISCSDVGGAAPYLPPVLASFRIAGDSVPDATVLVRDTSVVSFDSIVMANTITLTGMVNSDTIFLYLRFPGTAPGTYSWGGGKMDSVYARLTVRRANGLSAEYIPLPLAPHGSITISEYGSEIVGTFRGELARSNNGTIRVQISEGNFALPLGAR